MESQRLDLGPNRWMAAGGLAFLYVRVWKGWLLRLTAAPVRDIEFGRASFAGSPYGPFIVTWLLLMLCAGFPFVPLFLPMGDSEVFDWGWLILLLPIVICAINLFRRRGQFRLYISGDMTDVPVQIFIDRGKEETEPVRAFCECIAALRAEAGDGKRRSRTYLLFPWWTSIVFATILMLMAGFGAYYGLKQMGLVYAEICSVGVAILLTAIITTATPERALLFDRDIRIAESLLLRGDAEGARDILRRVFERKPNHKYGGTLLKFADLMQCDLQRAEDIVIQQYNPRPNLPSRYHRIMDYKLWESRHGDSSH